MNQGFVAFARLTEKRPGDGVEQRRFARAIGPGDAGQLEAGEIQLDGVVVREKAREFEPNGNHGSILLYLRACKSISPQNDLLRFIGE